jgi:hypothetical protein
MVPRNPLAVTTDVMLGRSDLKKGCSTIAKIRSAWAQKRR